MVIHAQARAGVGALSRIETSYHISRTHSPIVPAILPLSLSPAMSAMFFAKQAVSAFNREKPHVRPFILLAPLHPTSVSVVYHRMGRNPYLDHLRRGSV